MVRVAAATEGATGAELRELVRLGVLHTGGDITTDLLLRLVSDASATKSTGMYL